MRQEVEGRGRARAGMAVFVTTAVLLLLDWISSGSVGWPEALGIGVWVGAVLGALTLVAGRLDTRRMPVWRQLVILALTAGLASSLVNVFFVLVVTALPGLVSEGPAQPLGSAALVGFFDGDALFGFWALLVELPRRIGAEQKLEQERHALHQEAELARIRAALEPHFVINTLNTIAGLTTEDPGEARKLIATLGDLLRDTMQSRRSHHTVREEVRWLRGFARILETRHPGRLVFEWDVDRSVEGWALPVLLLQPLVENAVHYGALRRRDSGRIGLRIAGEVDRLRCAVQDDGPGFDLSAARPDGRGLELVRRRLAIESPEASLSVDSRPGATRVELMLPRRIG